MISQALLYNNLLSNKYKIMKRFEQQDRFEEQRWKPERSPQDFKKQLFTVINQINQKLSVLTGNVILLVGKTRVGKSTLHNFIVDSKMLIGQQDGVNTIYALKKQYVNRPKVAKIDNKIQSVTIVPNITKITEEDCHIADCPGFQDRRDETEVIQVEYILTKLFHSVKNAKFIIVFTQSSFKDIANDEFRETLQNFLSLFLFDRFTKDEKSRFYKSISFCVTSVDFKRKKAQKIQAIFIDQLSLLLDKLKAFSKSNPEAIPKFEIMQELITEIIKSKRIELFQLAEEDRSPSYTSTIQRLNKLGWRYFDLSANSQKTASRFQQLFKDMEQSKQQKIHDLVKWRFGLAFKFRAVLGRMLNDTLDSESKNIGIDAHILQMKTIIQTMPSYSQQFQLQVAPYLGADQKLAIFQQIVKINQSIQEFDQWRFQNNPSHPLLYYTSYLTSIFRQQVRLINRLFQSNKIANWSFKKMIVNIYKMLDQAAIFSKLSTNFQSDFKFKFKDQLNIGQEIPPLKQIKRKYIEFFLKSQLKESEYRQDQINGVIKNIIALKQEFTTIISPNCFYRIGCRLRQALSRINKAKQQQFPRQLSQSLLLQLQQHFYILIQTAKIHLNLIASKLPSEKLEILQVQRFQSEALNEIKNIVSQFNNNQEYLVIHQQSLFGFQSLKQSKSKDEAAKNVHSIIRIIASFGGLFKIFFNYDQMPLAINIVGKNREAELNAIVNQHLTFNKNQILDQRYKVLIPQQLSIRSEIDYSNEIIEKVRNKKGIIVLGEEKCGKSTIIYALKKMKICKVNGKYEIEGNKKSRINHNVRGDCFINLSPIDDNQFFIEFPSIFDKTEPDVRYIRICLLIKVLKSLSQFSIVLVQKDAQLKEASFISHIKNISTFLVQNQFPNKILSLIVNTNNLDRNKVRAILKDHIEALKASNEHSIKDNILNLYKTLYCQDIMNYNNLIIDFFGNIKFDSKKPTDNNYYFYNEVIPSNTKQTFTDKLFEKVKFLKSCTKWVNMLSQNCWGQFQEGKQYAGTKEFKELDKLLGDAIARQYEVEKLKIDKFQPIRNNRTLIYANIMTIKRVGKNIPSSYQYQKTYEDIREYLQNYFSRFAPLCCKDQHQYSIFIKMKYLFTSLLKQLQLYCKILKDKTVNLSDDLMDLDDRMRLRFITDQIDNFTQRNEYGLLKRLIGEKSKTQIPATQVINYINLLVQYSKEKIQNAICANVELIILMGVVKEYNWGNINQRGLIDETVNYLINQRMATNRLIESHRLMRMNELTFQLRNLKQKLLLN